MFVEESTASPRRPEEDIVHLNLEWCSGESYPFFQGTCTYSTHAE